MAFGGKLVFVFLALFPFPPSPVGFENSFLDIRIYRRRDAENRVKEPSSFVVAVDGE